MSAPRYEVTDLGWLQFEHLCTELMDTEAEIAPPTWTRHFDGVASVFLDRDLKHPLTDEVIPGPVCVAISWWRPRTTNRRVHLERVKRQVGEIPYEYGAGPMRMLVLTNIDAQGATEWGPPGTAQILDARALGELVDSSPELRRRVPSVLGVRADLDDLISVETLGRSTFDDAAARSLAPIFVATPAHAHALAVLQRYGFAVLTGPPEMGKTAIARMIGLAQLTDGWEVHECFRPSELWDRFEAKRKQVFIADDAFGSTEYQPESAERWARELDGILRRMDESHWLIWTSRPAPLRAGLRRVHRERGTEWFPQPAEVQVAASELEAADKALILFRHARAADLSTSAVDLVQDYGERIVDHPHFTPERIRRFVAGRLPDLAEMADADEDAVAAAVEEEIREPTTAMKASFEALGTEHRALLIALLDTPPGPVEEREVVAATRRHSDSGFPRPPSELIDRLTDHFLRVSPPTNVTWVHPSWRDLVIDQLCGDSEARQTFLRRCSIHGIALALSVGGGGEGERVLPLLSSDGDWDALTDRVLELLPELDSFELSRLLTVVGDVPATDLGEHATRELNALRRTVLDRLRDQWDAEGSAIPIVVLDAWFAAEAKLSPPLAVPALGPTWIEVLPVGGFDVHSDSDLSRWEDWVALVRLLTAYRRDELKPFGYPGRQLDALTELTSQAVGVVRSGASVDDYGRLARLVRQVLALPALRSDWRTNQELEAWVREAAVAEPEPAWSSEWRPSYSGERSIVDRILRDLEARS